jgi:hypothetical protein
MTISVDTTSGEPGILTTDHSQSSYGIPVFILSPPEPDYDFGTTPRYAGYYGKPLAPAEAAQLGIRLHEYTAQPPRDCQAPNGSREMIAACDAARNLARAYNALGERAMVGRED